MADNRTVSQLEAKGYPWIECECCKGTVWVPFKMLQEKVPMLSAMMYAAASFNVTSFLPFGGWIGLSKGRDQDI